MADLASMTNIEKTEMTRLKFVMLYSDGLAGDELGPERRRTIDSILWVRCMVYNLLLHRVLWSDLS